MEKIVRDYFPYIMETETMTFTDCVKCLITFTNSKFNNDASLNAIAFLRFYAVKLAEGGFVCSDKNVNCHVENGEEAPPEHKDDLMPGLECKDDTAARRVRRLTRVLPPHFALGRGRQHHVFAVTYGEAIGK